MRRSGIAGAALAAALVVTACADREATAPLRPSFNGTGGLAPIEELGKAIFFDGTLSINGKQSCASCHNPAWGWTGPDSDVNAAGAVYEGALPNRFGARKPPTSAYATFSPVFFYDEDEGLFIGGNFWDGRATGERLGNPAADQALGPFLNPVEQALHVPADVVKRVCRAPYASLFDEVWGEGACDKQDPAAYDRIGLSIAAFEASSESNAFTSKYDAVRAGAAEFTDEEQLGFDLFVDEETGKCVLCHVLEVDGTPALFTDFTFDNLGIPENPANPHFPVADPGLGGFLASRPDYADYASDFWGMHKVPTLRNVDLRPDPGDVKAYGHNGYFKSLWEIVHFYNTRDVKDPCPGAYTSAEALAADCWPAPEIADNVNTGELGDLGLDLDEEMAIVEFLKTLSDGYF